MICKRNLSRLSQFCTENKNYDHISNSAQEHASWNGPRKRLVKAVEGGRSANSILRYMCIQKLPYDHGFAQKQPKSVFDASIKFYYHKRDAMAIFCVSSAILRYFAYWEL